MKIAYFSPLSPKRSGISHYSEQLLMYLKSVCEVDVWVDGFSPTNETIQKKFRIFDYVKSPRLLKKLNEYDHVIYNIGNNPEYHATIYDVFLKYPGIVILHDLVIYYLITGYYLYYKNNPTLFLKEMVHNSGKSGFYGGLKILRDKIPPLQFKFPHLYPLTRRVIESAKGIIVHSQFAKREVLKLKPDAKCMTISHLCPKLDAFEDPNFIEIKKKYNINESEIVLASFGYVAPTKRVHQILHALSSLKPSHSFKYILAGEGDYVKGLINELKLNDSVITTGFIPLDEFDQLIHGSDIILNLRYPYFGESSGTLARALAYGKACVVSDIGWFSELPDDAVMKVPTHSLEMAKLTNAIQFLIENKEFRKQMGGKAALYAQTFMNGRYIARKIVDFCRQTM